MLTKPLRVGLVTAFPPGRNSLNEFGFQLAKHLEANENVEQLVVFHDETDRGTPEPLGTTEFVESWEFNSLATLTRLVAKIRKSDLDFVLFNLQFASFGDTKIAGGLGLLAPMLTKLGLRVPTGVILHNLVENVDMADAGFASNKLIAKVMSLAGKALTRSLLTADYVGLTIPNYVEQLQDLYGAKNAILIPHGTFEEVDEPVFAKSGPVRLLAFGKWGTYKTVDGLIEAFRLLNERGHTDLELEIAGTDSPNAPGYLAAVQSGVSPSEKIEFTGYIAEEDVATVFTNSTISVFPYSSTTGSSGVLHQAGSYGLPAVLPDIGDFSEVIESEGFCGEYFEPENAESLADAIERLILDPNKSAQMGERNFRAAAGIPFSEIIDWHLIHMDRLIKG